jgi:type III pantothenate kinase
MILLLDVGNTRVKWAWLEYLDIAPAGAVAHDATHRSWQAEIEADGHRPTRIVAANVAGAGFARALTRWSAVRFGLEPELILAQDSHCGVVNSYPRPATLGVDRWLGMIAAWKSAPRATCIVASGTALTVDTLDAAGRHCGGLVLPGVQMMSEARAALGADPALTPAAELPGLAAFGPTQSIPVTLAAVADRSVAELGARIGAPPRVLLTGGDAGLLEPYLASAVEVVPDLVLTGLAIVATARPAS